MQAKNLERLRDALAARGVDYLLIGRGGAIVQGYADTTQDIDLFVDRTADNAGRLIEALKDSGLVDIDEKTEAAIRQGKDFIQIEGAAAVDVIHAPDGIENFDDAWNRGREVDGYRTACLDDIIASKKAANRARDREALPRLERYRRWMLDRGEQPGRRLPPRKRPAEEEYPRRPSSEAPARTGRRGRPPRAGERNRH